MNTSPMLSRHQMKIILVHGTWGRGIFPYLRSMLPQRTPFWFSEGSKFRRELQTALSNTGILPRTEAFIWSGANSVRHRSDAADRLCVNSNSKFNHRHNLIKSSSLTVMEVTWRHLLCIDFVKEGVAATD
jgi:hypothetical protein